MHEVACLNLDIKSKALLIGRVFRFLQESEVPWKDFMRYYIGRALGINDNSKPNSEIPTPFYSHLLRVLREFAVDLGQPCTSKMYYLKRIEDCVTPVQARSELAWDQRFGPGLIWKEIWKDVARSFNDPVLRDFDWARYIWFYLSISECINGIHEYPQHVHGVVKEWKH